MARSDHAAGEVLLGVTAVEGHQSAFTCVDDQGIKRGHAIVGGGGGLDAHEFAEDPPLKIILSAGAEGIAQGTDVVVSGGEDHLEALGAEGPQDP